MSGTEMGSQQHLQATAAYLAAVTDASSSFDRAIAAVHAEVTFSITATSLIITSLKTYVLGACT
jgi:hypothetical protein